MHIDLNRLFSVLHSELQCNGFLLCSFCFTQWATIPYYNLYVWHSELQCKCFINVTSSVLHSELQCKCFISRNFFCSAQWATMKRFLTVSCLFCTLSYNENGSLTMVIVPFYNFSVLHSEHCDLDGPLPWPACFAQRAERCSWAPFTPGCTVSWKVNSMGPHRSLPVMHSELNSHLDGSLP